MGPKNILRTLRRIGPKRFARTAHARLRRWIIGIMPVHSSGAGQGPRFSGGSLQRAIRSGEFAECRILSAKFDAFGGRLWNLLNAARVAEALGAQLRFYWPMRPMDGIRPADAVFDASYLERHELTVVDLGTLRNVRTWTPGDLAYLRGTDRMIWYEAKHRDPDFDKFDVAARGHRFKELPTYAEAFRSIRFSPGLERVRSAVDGVERLALAVHVRRGDVYRGDFRLGGQGVRKAIPLPIVGLILGRLLEGERAVLISDDDARIRDRLGVDPSRVLISSEVLDWNGDDLERTFRDFCLFTRCDRVIAGSSVFAVIPTLIGGGLLESPDETFDSSHVRTVVTEFVEREAGRPDLEVALACVFLEDRFRGRLTESERDRLLAIAVEADPENPGLVVAQAARLIRLGHVEAAQALFERTATGGAAEFALRLTKHSLDIVRGVGFTAIDGSFLETRDWETMESAIASVPWAAYYVGLRLLALGDRDRARSALASAAQALNHVALRAALDLFERSEGLTPTPAGLGLSNGPSEDEGL
jgi:hypothetical protein